MGGLAFLFLYGEKVFKRVFPPTVARMKNPFYKGACAHATHRIMLLLPNAICPTPTLPK
jgi:hypothetical protein